MKWNKMSVKMCPKNVSPNVSKLSETFRRPEAIIAAVDEVEVDDLHVGLYVGVLVEADVPAAWPRIC